MKILLVDNKLPVLRGVTRIINCERSDWSVQTAQSGEEALATLGDDQEFDVIVSEMQMHDMDGAQLLETVSQRHPSILRVVLSGHVDRETVLRAVKPMHQFLSKPCEGKKLVDVIQSARILQSTIRSSEVLAAIGRANGLPTFPAIVNELNVALELENSTSKSLAAIVSKDPILSARVLQLANSSIFSLRNPVTDVEKGISAIGIDMIRTLAISQAVFTDSENDSGPISAQRLFDHSFRVAGLGKRLADTAGRSRDESNLVFSAGLLHDIGKILLCNSFPDEYIAIVAEAAAGSLSMQHVEMQHFDATHQGVGAYLLTLWGLPPEVVQAVASHHSFDACSQAENSVCGFVFAANWIDGAHHSDELSKHAEQSSCASSANRFAVEINEWQTMINADEG